jgi:hypothetical protein
MKIITRIKGGLGNQLFCYAAARRLALINHAELVIDDVTGFVRDQQYRRQYALDNFHITCRKATPKERMEPFERYRRGFLKWLSYSRPFLKRCYLEQEGNGFDERLLNFKPQELVYLDGLWQSEDYFKDVEQNIRDDLRIIPPIDVLNQRMAEEICNSNAIALHVRWFDMPGTPEIHNISDKYYLRAIAMINAKIKSPRYFIFSDNPKEALGRLGLTDKQATLVDHNNGDESAYADLWLMTQCQHFVIANSTFSWWGAWLSCNPQKIVIYPCGEKNQDKPASFNFSGDQPLGWIEL